MFIALHPVPRRNVIPMWSVRVADNCVGYFQRFRWWQCRLMPLNIRNLACHLMNGRKSEVSIEQAPRPGENPEPEHFAGLDDLRYDAIFACAGLIYLVGLNLSQTDTMILVSRTVEKRLDLPIKSELDQASSCEFRENGEGQHDTRQS
jgi:hypothetical protein